MYVDSVKKHTGRNVAIILALLVLEAGTVFFVEKSSARTLSTESAEAIEDAVSRIARQCYVVEGVYPPNLAYMEENYGLKVNKEDYVIEYSAFSSNLPPLIKVVPYNH